MAPWQNARSRTKASVRFLRRSRTLIQQSRYSLRATPEDRFPTMSGIALFERIRRRASDHAGARGAALGERRRVRPFTADAKSVPITITNPNTRELHENPVIPS